MSDKVISSQSFSNEAPKKESMDGYVKRLSDRAIEGQLKNATDEYRELLLAEQEARKLKKK